MRFAVTTLCVCAAAWLCPAGSHAAEPLPPAVVKALARSGLPLKSFGFHVQPVEADTAAAFTSLNAEQPFVMASTTKLVTSLAALDLLGPEHLWRTQAFATAPVDKGRLVGDLVIVGGSAGLTPAELSRWFRQMRAEGLTEVKGRIVLERVSLLHEQQPAQAATTAAERSPGPVDAQTYHRGALVVSVQPTRGERAAVSLSPNPGGVHIINEVSMGGGCAAWARWQTGPGSASGAPQLWVSGRWDTSCGSRPVAHVRLPATARIATSSSPPPLVLSTPSLVAELWAASGGKLRGRVVETQQRISRPAEAAALDAWSSEVAIPLPDVIREINKTSNNLAARSLLLALSPLASAGALGAAQARVHAWLRAQGLADGDIRIDQGSGQSRIERGKPRALVQLLLNAWRGSGSKAFVDSLPIAGVDGTLAHRMRNGLATGHAYLKTGTLSDARALAGYVRAKSGKVYAMAAIVNHPDAARATPALDAMVEWLASNG